MNPPTNSPRRAVIVSDAEGLDRETQAALAALLPTWSTETLLVLLADTTGGRRSPLDKSLTEALAKHGQVVICAAAGKGQLRAALAQEAATSGKRLAPTAAGLLEELTGVDFDLACRELDKLVTYVGERETIQPADVDALVSSSAEVQAFKLGDALGDRNARAALRLLDELLPPTARRGAGIPLLGSVTRQLRLLWQARALLEAGGAGQEQVRGRFPDNQNLTQATAGRQAWLAEKLARQARGFSAERLARAYLLAYETDRRLKGRGEGQVDDRLAFELLISEVCR